MATSNRRPPEVTRDTVTHEGGPAWSAGVFDELLITAVSTFLGERTFYETPSDRERRLVDLVHRATHRDADYTARLIASVRREYRIRHAALLMAIEYVRAGGPNGRSVVDSVIQRPDEPAELLAIWQSRYGAGRFQGKTRDMTGLPMAVRKGVADGLARTLTERNYVKYVGQSRKLVTIADAIELTHPKPVGSWQSALFKYALDEAHHGDGMKRYIAARQDGGIELPMIYEHARVGQLPEGVRREQLRAYPTLLEGAGYTWEALSGWLPGGMDAEAWEYAIPHMGVMALLRNLRNFDQAGISSAAQSAVEGEITDAATVTRSRIFPYQVWSAYANAPSDRWKHPLAMTLDLATFNVPSFDRTLFLVDMSGSMTNTLSGRSETKRYELATVMGVTAFMRASHSDLAVFADQSARVDPVKGLSTMGFVTDLVTAAERHMWTWLGGRSGGFWNSPPSDPLAHLGQGTRLHTAIANQFDPKRHERVIVFTDDQAFDSSALSAHVPEIIYFNLGGFAPQSDWGKRRIHLAGFTDAAFRAVAEVTG